MSDDRAPDDPGEGESDVSEAETAGAETGGQAGVETTTPEVESEAGATSDASRVRRFLDYALFAALTVVALVAVVGLYTAVSAAISTWVTSEFRPLFRAVFNLVVLLLAVAGIARQAGRLTS
jgi:hypothetical protein